MLTFRLIIFLASNWEKRYICFGRDEFLMWKEEPSIPYFSNQHKQPVIDKKLMGIILATKKPLSLYLTNINYSLKKIIEPVFTNLGNRYTTFQKMSFFNETRHVNFEDFVLYPNYKK